MDRVHLTTPQRKALAFYAAQEDGVSPGVIYAWGLAAPGRPCTSPVFDRLVSLGLLETGTREQKPRLTFRGRAVLEGLTAPSRDMTPWNAS